MARKRLQPAEWVPTWDSTADLEEAMDVMFPPTPDGLTSLPRTPVKSIDLTPVISLDPTPVKSTVTDSNQTRYTNDLTPVRSNNPTPVKSIDRTPVESNDATPVTSTPVESSDLTRVTSTPVGSSDFTPVTSTPVESDPDRSECLRGHLFRLTMATDAFTEAEEKLAKYMWTVGEPMPGTDLVRLCSISTSEIGRVMHRAGEKSIRNLVQSLINKLSISVARESDAAYKIPKTYYVYHFNEMHARRLQRGWTWGLKNHGVQLLTDREASVVRANQRKRRSGGEPGLAPLPVPDLLLSTPVKSVDLTPIRSHEAPRVIHPPVTPVRSHDVTGVLSSPHPNKDLEEKKQIKNDDVAALVSVLQPILGQCDDEAAVKILTACWENAPTAPLEHVLRFAVDVAYRARAARNLNNPIGLVIVQTPKCLTGESYALFLQSEQRRQEEQSLPSFSEAEMRELVEHSRKILADPKSTPSDKTLAEEFLKDHEA